MTRTFRPRWRLSVHHDGFWLLTPTWSVSWWPRGAKWVPLSIRSKRGRLGYWQIEKRCKP